MLLRYDDEHLHVLWNVTDNTPWLNRGTSAPLAFKTGDSVNLFVAPADGCSWHRSKSPHFGDLPPTGPAGEGFVFESPVPKSRFARSRGRSHQRKVSGQSRSPVLFDLAAIPWKALGIDPRKGLKLRGDLGVLLSDDSGGATAQRVHWADRETNVVNDVPTEAEFSPLRWGDWELD